MAGATHLVEHLTLRRCGAHDRRSLAALVDRLGGEVDAWTGFESMGVTVQTTVDALEEGIALLVDAVLTPTFDDGDVELERRVALAELELIRDDPVERVEDALLAAAWGDHPLARPVIGTEDSLAALTPLQLRRHHDSLVQPGRVLAAVSGDVDVGEVTHRLRRLPLHEPPASPVLPHLGWHGRHQTVLRPGTDQAHVRLAFEGPASGDPELVVLTVLNRILGVGASSRLFQRLREDEGLTYDIWSAPVPRRQGGLLEIGWACAPDVFDDVWRLVIEELSSVAGTLEDEEVEIASEGLRRGLAIDSESPVAFCAMDVAETLERGRRFDPDLVAAEISTVTTAQVRELAARLLRPDNMASAIGGPEGLSVQVA
jgi:predicted Zn-dependent peptidase